MNLDEEVLRCFRRFGLCCQPKFTKTKNNYSAIYALNYRNWVRISVVDAFRAEKQPFTGKVIQN